MEDGGTTPSESVSGPGRTGGVTATAQSPTHQETVGQPVLRKIDYSGIDQGPGPPFCGLGLRGVAGEVCGPLLRKFCRDNVDLLDVRWLSEEFVGPRHQRLGDLAGQVRLSARVIREHVEDCELRWSKADREPCRRIRLPLDQREPSFKKALHLFFLPRLRLQRNE